MKWNQHRRIPILFAFVLLVAVLSGCAKGADASEKSARAVLDEFLNCSVKEAEDFDTMLEEGAAETTGEPGIVSISGVEAYFEEKLGDSMTEECFKEVTANRTCSLSMALAKEHASDITTGEMELKKRSGEQNVFDFSAKLVAGTDKEPVSSVSGTIVMVQDGKTWKASDITIDMKKKN